MTTITNFARAANLPAAKRYSILNWMKNFMFGRHARQRVEEMTSTMINENALLSALFAAKSSHPNEFLGFFQGTEKNGDTMLEELIIPPTLYRNKTSVGFNDWQIPSMSGIKGTFHSHPWPPASPSRQDKEMFGRKSNANFIACPPFGIENVRAFDNKGREIRFIVVKQQLAGDMP